MEKFDNSVTQTEMKALREGIKNKYKEYNSTDRDRFPEFEYNTNRANYEPLRLSFDEEFFVLRGINRTRNSLHIPSNNTLALIFSDDNYVPGRKILDTCRSYAEGRLRLPFINAESNSKQQRTANPAVLSRIVLNRIIIVGSLLLMGLVVYIATIQRTSIPSPTGLVIDRPSQSKIVPRELLIGGRVSGADTVWIVVRPVGGIRYWVQPPIKVGDDNTWRGPIYIGSEDVGDVGIRSQLRAFVNPASVLKDGDVLRSWPEAELSSNTIEVVRGSKEIEE